MKLTKRKTLGVILCFLVIISILLIVNVNRFLYLKKRVNYYMRVENEIIKASEVYYSNNLNFLPKDDGKKRVVLNALVVEGYIKKVLDINNKECDLFKSYVEVVKDSDDYIYKVHLVCNNDNYITGKEE